MNTKTSAADWWVYHLRQGNPVWDIGQLDKPTVSALDRLARAGEASKSREWWNGLRLKAVWRLQP